MSPDPKKSQPRAVRSQALTPRGLSRSDAAAYIGVSASLFDEMVDDGRMPRPKLINTRNVWDKFAVDDAFDNLPTKGAVNPWDEVYG
ncbi:MAG: XRE family transcriptional regulator [Candidatus Devosia phytovorans]|uniref:XRE family transcriptional regulator n=1 Tax=Candidatus Devosia phytovorans TaxID=3121372 RepID=A0AAJ5W0C8_9HYPH|nr:XRE family transcriptional regulator [Devosia sp.]WEK06799.1 MAG: XRE family transcriptional regulator [Devosia sp.]